MSAGNGWIGRLSQVLHYLDVVGAEKNAEGQFMIYGSPVTSFMGLTGNDAEVLVPCDAEYAVGGHRANLAAGLSSTSYGLAVTVIS